MFTIGVLAVFGAASSGTASHGGPVLVVVAHPDDEALAMSGVISHASAAGRRVYVAVLTNGDSLMGGSESGYCGAASGAGATTAHYGLRRNAETMAGMNLLGLQWSADEQASDIFFLGYPDGRLTTVASRTSPWTDDATGLHRTYAEDLDGSNATCNGDLRYLLDGRHSQLMRSELQADLDSLLALTQPEDIYTHSFFDGSGDHAETNRQVLAAVQRANDPVTLHTSLIHPEGTSGCLPLSAGQWPNPSIGSVGGNPVGRFTPTLDVTAPPVPACSTNPSGTNWGSGGPPNELVEVPTPMQATTEASNLKWQVISRYATQIDCNPSSDSYVTCGYMRAFVKRREFFWVESFTPGNTAPSATLTKPAAGASFTAPATIELEATAGDSDGSVQRVEFLANGSVVATDTTVPYSATWTGVAAGPYQLAARAVDDDDAATTSTPVSVTVTTSGGSSPPGSGMGLQGEYFDNSNFTSPQINRVDPLVNFYWGGGSPAPQMGNDTFSVRWTGQVEPRFSETYTFYTTSDDGVRLWVNGQLLINNWTDHAPTENSGTISLTAGVRYDIRMEYYENSGGALAQLRWSSVSEPKDFVPQTQLYPPGSSGNTAPTVSLTRPTSGAAFTAPATIEFEATAADADGAVSSVEFLAAGVVVGTDSTAPYAFTWNNVPPGSYQLAARAVDDDLAATTSAAASVVVSSGGSSPPGSGIGLQGEYFDNSNLTGLALTRVDPVVNFYWGGGSPAPSIGADTFSVRWTGQVEPRFSEIVTFSTVSDDGVRLWVNGQLLVNNWTDHAPTENSGTISLTAGVRYDIRMEYYENGGGALAQLHWSSASQARQIVPQSQLYPPGSSGNTPPTVSLTLPANGDAFSAPATIALAATAGDTDGNVDKVEFLVNGTPVATDTTSPFETTWSNVPPGSYQVSARATDDAGATTTSTTASIVVSSGTSAPPGTGTGLRGEYYDTSTFTNLRVTRLDPVVNFYWGGGSPDPTIGVDTFSIRWTGQVQPRFSEVYTFTTLSDDGIRVWVNGQLLIDNWTDHPPTENAGSLVLAAGVRYDLRIDYYENGGGALAQLYWSSPSQTRQIVPQSQLYPPG